MRTPVVTQQDAIAKFIRQGVYFEQLIRELNNYSPDIALLEWDGRYTVKSPSGHVDYWSIESAIKAYLDALTGASNGKASD